jgi:acetoin utilization deacetylase AcuC-like enzyme
VFAPLLLISSDRFEDHVTPPGHPERVERAEVFSGIALWWRDRGGRLAEPEQANREHLLRVHRASYIDEIADSRGRAEQVDPDTFTSPETYDVALLAAGSACVAVDYALNTSAPAFALVRPPGHHAEADKAMGFCFFNNVAVGAAYAQARGLHRVAIVDFDVHHGNGTQWMFYDNPSVLYVSTHQYPFYPGTGAATEIGSGSGQGRTLNVPLEAGATDADYDLAFSELIVPALEAFEPDLLLVSAGFDAHDRDPLAAMRLSKAGFSTMMGRLWRVASEHCSNRLVAITEGGYDLSALSECLEATIEVLSAPPSLPQSIAGDSSRARRAIDVVRTVQQPFWPAL